MQVKSLLLEPRLPGSPNGVYNTVFNRQARRAPFLDESACRHNSFLTPSYRIIKVLLNVLCVSLNTIRYPYVEVSMVYGFNAFARGSLHHFDI